MKIVKFDDGYALRRFNFASFRYEYKDISPGGVYWWPKNSRLFSDCLADSEEEVRRKAGLRKVEEKIDVC